MSGERTSEVETTIASLIVESSTDVFKRIRKNIQLYAYHSFAKCKNMAV